MMRWLKTIYNRIAKRHKLQEFEAQKISVSARVKMNGVVMLAQEAIKLMAEYPGASNYLSMKFGDPATLKVFEVVIREVEGQTPSDRVACLERVIVKTVTVAEWMHAGGTIDEYNDIVQRVLKGDEG